MPSLFFSPWEKVSSAARRMRDVKFQQTLIHLKGHLLPLGEGSFAVILLYTAKRLHRSAASFPLEALNSLTICFGENLPQ